MSRRTVLAAAVSGEPRLGPVRVGLRHLSGLRDRGPDGEWAGLRCVLCEQVLPERSRGISQDSWVLISDARSAGRPVFQLELRDDVLHDDPVALGPLLYYRCDSTSASLPDPA